VQFRKNINALRAVGVISVMFFHFRIGGFGGGFSGVDIFFVISGFLMTGIIFTGLQEQRFSLLEFYASRARRIVPALLVLCVALLLFGFVYLPLDDFRQSVKTMNNSLLFISNFDYAKRNSYFDAPLHENWMLHTWALSIQWQFYMLYPVILMALFKLLGEKRTKIALVLLALVSLAASVIFTRTLPAFSFYLLPTRAWELLAGGLVFVYPLQFKKRTGYFFEGIGLAAILAGIFCFSEQNLWPGYLASIPVLGAVLVIYGNTGSVFSSNRALQFTGKISYSVYLWHWPIVVFLYTCGTLGSWKYVLPSIFLSFALGALSFYLVESRVKKTQQAPKALFKFAGLVVAAVAVFSIISSVVKSNPGVRFVFVEQSPPEYTSKLYTKECYPNEFDASDCKLGTGEISVILFGDSQAESTAAAVQLENKATALLWARAGCPTLTNFEMLDKELERVCRGFNQAKLDVLGRSYQGVPVILLSRTALYSDSSRGNKRRVFFNGDDTQDSQKSADAFTEEYVRTVCVIAKNHPVYIVRPIPEMPFNVYKGLNLHARIFHNKSDISVPLKDYEKRNKIANFAIDAAGKHCKAQIIDPVPFLCPNGKCMGSKNGVPLYFDDNHLVDSGNKQLEGMFKGIVWAK